MRKFLFCLAGVASGAGLLFGSTAFVTWGSPFSEWGAGERLIFVGVTVLVSILGGVGGLIVEERLEPGDPESSAT